MSSLHLTNPGERVIPSSPSLRQPYADFILRLLTHGYTLTIDDRGTERLYRPDGSVGIIAQLPGLPERPCDLDHGALAQEAHDKHLRPAHCPGCGVQLIADV